jgi:hypothetical protein
MLTVFMGVATIALAAIVVAMCFAFSDFLDFLGSEDMEDDDENEKGDR